MRFKHLQRGIRCGLTWFLASVVPSLLMAADPPQGLLQFKLTKGHGIRVCEAYLKRLQSTHFDRPPYCGRPENDSVPGFSFLHRVPLTPEEVATLVNRVSSFAHTGDQFKGDRAEAARHRLGMKPEDRDRLIAIMKSDLPNLMNVWRYDPPVSIENNGIPENLVIWLGGSAIGSCGSIPSNLPEPFREDQWALVLTKDSAAIDVEKTLSLFGHPYPYSVVRPGVPDRRPRLVGPNVGIFEYEGVDYFDTFFDFFGDFDNRRAHDDQLLKTLGVFMRKDHVTKQMCEYTVSGMDLGF